MNRLVIAFMSVMAMGVMPYVYGGGLLRRANQQASDVASAYGETWTSFYGTDAYRKLLTASLDKRSDGAPNIVVDSQSGKLTATIRLSVNEPAYNAWKMAAHQRLANSGLRFKVNSSNVDEGRVIGGRNFVFEENDEAAIKRWEQQYADYRKLECAEKAIRVVVQLIDAKGKVVRKGDVLLEKFFRKNAPYNFQRPLYRLNRLQDLPESRYDWKGVRDDPYKIGNSDESALAEVNFTDLSVAELDALEDVRCEIKALEVFDYDECIEGGVKYRYHEKSKSWEVESCERNIQGEVRVLAMLKGYKVTKIKSMAIANRNEITKVAVDDGIEVVGHGAFCRCPKLVEVTIPNSVTNLERESFAYCPKLSKVTLSQSIVRIEDCMFSCCEALQGVKIPAGVTMIENSAFSRCDSLVEMMIPMGVTHLGDHAFQRCKGLRQVSLPVGLRYIGKEAFRDCAALAQVKVAGERAFLSAKSDSSNDVAPMSLQHRMGGTWRGRLEERTGVGVYAFRGCIALTDVTIPGAVKEIGDSVFCDCKALKSVTIQPGVECIGENAFWNLHKLVSAKMPSTVRKIGKGSFSGCKVLTEVELPEGVEILGYDVFAGCSELSHVTIPSSMKTIGRCSFSMCDKLTKVIIPAQLKDYKEAFYESSGLAEVVFAEGSKQIAEGAFFGCRNLTRVTIPASMKTIGANAFFACRKLSQVKVPVGVTEIGRDAFPRDTKITRK